MDEQTLTIPEQPDEATATTDIPVNLDATERPIPSKVPVCESHPLDLDAEGFDQRGDPGASAHDALSARDDITRNVGPGLAKPFAVTLVQMPSGQPGHTIPSAHMEIEAALRSSGLLAALPADEVKTLVCLLTFLSSNGDILPTAWEVAEALRISEGKAKDRLTRLVRFRWQERPIVATLWRESGVTAYTVSPEFIAYRQAAVPERSAPTPVYRAAGREAIIAHSRAQYTRPRAEVERQIAMTQGWPLPEDDPSSAEPGLSQTGIAPEEYLRQRLYRLGVTPEQVELLMTTFPPEEIEAQIAWLPYRGAKNPASYLVAAITGHYAEPGLLKVRREMQPEASPEVPHNGSDVGAP